MKHTNTKEIIARTAIELVAERGVDAVSMRDIARVVGVSEAAIYRHFSNKNELVWEVFTTHYDLFAQRLDTVQSQHNRFEDKLAAMVDACCTLFDEDCDLFVFLLVAQHIQRYAPKDYDAAMPRLLAALLTESVAKGDVPPHDAELATAMIMGSVIQTALYCLYFKPEPKKMTGYSAEISAACYRIVKGN